MGPESTIYLLFVKPRGEWTQKNHAQLCLKSLHDFGPVTCPLKSSISILEDPWHIMSSLLCLDERRL